MLYSKPFPHGVIQLGRIWRLTRRQDTYGHLVARFADCWHLRERINVEGEMAVPDGRIWLFASK